MSISIKVENLSKAYQLGEIGTGTISRDLERYWAKLRGKEDPFLKIGEANDRTQKGNSNIVWSLKDLNFEIEQGDAVGIIGRNGAGKSTLLKILSRVTSPTTGSVKIKGRVASLLEVGTGFHPELTGGENIFLNGAILGMRKAEIKKHFDAIVDFAGVERYIDTPVKRYSSGMYVRLAFAVAAHLESEILVVDEVLAVGDTEFQKKCLGKMNDVSKGEGRTVLFVSHNIPAVISLCRTGLILNNGTQNFIGEVNNSIDAYLSNTTLGLEKEILLPEITKSEILNNKKIKIRRIKINQEKINYLSDLCLQIDLEAFNNIDDLVIGIGINSITTVRLLTVENLMSLISLKTGLNLTANVIIPKLILSPGQYTLSVGVRGISDKTSYDYLPDIIKFEVETTPEFIQLSNNPQLGLRPISHWTYH